MATHDPEPTEPDDWPELTAIAGIIHRCRVEASKKPSTIKIAFQIELVSEDSPSGIHITEKYVIMGTPADGIDPDSAEYKKKSNQLKNLIKEELIAAFGKDVEDISDDRSNSSDTETLLEGNQTEATLEIPGVNLIHLEEIEKKDAES